MFCRTGSCQCVLRKESGILEQLRLALRGYLLFSHNESKLIRAEARRRITLQTGILKEQRLAAVDQKDEARVITQSD